MAELVDVSDSKSDGVIRVGSSPTIPTIIFLSLYLKSFRHIDLESYQNRTTFLVYPLAIVYWARLVDAYSGMV